MTKLNSAAKKALKKIKKLLALAESSNPNEALLAAKRARQLMDQHSLSKEDIENAQESEFLESMSEHQYRQRNAWVIELQAAVATLNDCEGVLSPKDGSVRHMFRGFVADAVVAKLTFDYLIESCERCCAAEKSQKRITGRSELNQFRLGFAYAIARKIEEIQQKREQMFTSTTGTNLVELKSQQVIQHFGQLKSHKRQASRPPTQTELEAYLSGLDAGNKTSLDKQVEGEESLKLKSAQQRSTKDKTMTKQISLKPCPFCGSEAEFVKTSTHWVRCTNEGYCSAETDGGKDDTQREAAEIWNRRAEPKLTIMAGRYEQGYLDDENIKFTSPELPFEEAFELLKKHQPSNPSRFAFMEYDGYRMTLYQGGLC